MIFDTLNDEQKAVVMELKDFILTRPELEVVLEGPAGTGKTYCMKALTEIVKKRMVFTAPTNKAVKVLRDALTTSVYRPECRTIYSLLGLQMKADGEVKVIAKPDDEVDLSEYSVVVVDEASMVNQQLRAFIIGAQVTHPKIKWILMGDRWQLPPVGEDMSPVWEIKDRFELRTIMRQDNTILQLATQVRGLIQTPMKSLVLARTDDVKPLSALDFGHSIVDDAAAFLAGRAKAIAWRNISVQAFNRSIRNRLFAESVVYPWQEGDRITTTEPVKEFDGDKILAATDDEGTVENADVRRHPIYGGFDCWRIQMRKDDNQIATLWALHPRAEAGFQRELTQKSAMAKSNPRLWRDFWAFKDSFHQVRHAYAITAHRAQGSTYEKAYVNWRDILLNQNRSEAYRCLYVAVTRPKKELYLG